MAPLKLVCKHQSLAVMIAGSAAIFFSSIMLKTIMSSEQYGYYGMLMTIIWMINSFGLFGAEQAFIRTSVIKSDGIVISRKMVHILQLSVLLGPVIATFSLREVVPGLSLVWAYLISLGTVVSMFFYNYYRLRSWFLISQIVQNSWRIGLGLAVLFFYIVGYYDIIVLDLVKLLATIMLTVLLPLSYLLFKGRIIEVEGAGGADETKLTLAFCFSLVCLSVLQNYDRFVVEHINGINVFGEYFFLISLYTLPLGVFAGYVGFKSLVHYKHEFSLSKLNSDMVTVGMLFFMLGLLLLVAIYIASLTRFITIDYEERWTLILPLLIAGVLKGPLALVSAGMGAVGNSRPMFKANMATIIGVSVVGLVLLLDNNVGIESVAWSVVLMWILRYILFYFGIRASVK